MVIGAQMTILEFPTAKDVSEYLLRRSGDALFSGDFNAFAACFALPQKMETFDGRKLVETEEDLRSIFDGVRAYYRSLGVTILERRCIAARFATADRVEATHVSRLISGASIVQTPYPVFSIIERGEPGWRVVHSKYAISDAPAHNRALSSRLRDAAPD